MEFIKSRGENKNKNKSRGAWGGPCGSQTMRECVFPLQVLLKPTIIYGKGRTR
jgi:hypothetical protein